MTIRRSRVFCLLAAVLLPMSWAVPASAGQPSSTSPSPVTPVQIAVGDEAVTGTGDVAGYHLYASAAADGWSWHALATIQPGGSGDERWIGRQCLTGDGDWVVAVVAPWSASNSEAGMNQGGLAYAVDAHTGAVHSLVGGVSLAYFSPTCGAGDDVTLTSYLGAGQQPTLATVLDAGTGAVLSSARVPEEVTSAAWQQGRIVAARGAQLVDITSGAAQVLDTFAGQVADLHASADGGLDLVAQQADNAQAWHLATDRSRHLLASGSARDLQVFSGRAGHNAIVGAAGAARSPGGTQVLAGLAHAESVSLDGGLAVVAPLGSPALSRVDSVRLDGHRASPTSQGTLPVAATRGSAALPARRLGTSQTMVGPGTGSALVLAAQVDPGAIPADPPNTSTPACAVGRNDIFQQVWQPTSDQVRWAVNQAVQGALSTPRPTDPQMYAASDNPYQQLTAVPPSVDFPPVSGAPAVPPLVMYGILAQESAFNQASWHAAPGRSGNPLIANYYGTDATATTIDYNNTDCGYGIAQITDGMAFPAGSTTPTQRQLRVAVDYATDVAAGAQILQTKWQQLAGLGIIPAGASGSTVENWYTAIWAYNSGAYTDPTNRMGLGWLNNPANPIYPAVDHRTFLHDGTTQTYDDSNTPANWPYQERVLGWMEVPQVDLNGDLEYRGTYDWDSATVKGTFLKRPGYTAFCNASNSCTPTNVGTGVDPCPLESSACWWDQPVPACTSACTTDTPSQAPNGHTYYPTPGAAEPSAPAQDVVCASSPGNTAVIVDDERLDASKNPTQRTPNLMGCAAGTTGPTSPNASFTFTDAAHHDVLSTPGSVPAIDLHQIGAGLGGHLFFTHTQSSAALGLLGTWSASLTASPYHGTVYQVRAFVPDLGAAASATYTINSAPDGTPGQVGSPGTGQPLRVTIDQSAYPNQWVTLGNYLCAGSGIVLPGGPSRCDMSVSLSTVTAGTGGTPGADIAFDAVAFVPVPASRYVPMSFPVRH